MILRFFLSLSIALISVLSVDRAYSQPARNRPVHFTAVAAPVVVPAANLFRVSGMNDLGDVVGASRAPTPPSLDFVEALLLPSGFFGQLMVGSVSVLGINDHREIMLMTPVGTGVVGGGYISPSTGFVQIPNPGGILYAPSPINNLGFAGGRLHTVAGQRGALWHSTLLPTPVDINVISPVAPIVVKAVLSISDNLSFLGEAQTPNASGSPYFFSRIFTGTVNWLDAPLTTFYPYLRWLSGNDRFVAGQVSACVNGCQFAAVWDLANATPGQPVVGTVLPTPSGVTGSSVVGISNRGLIAGSITLGLFPNYTTLSVIWDVSRLPIAMYVLDDQIVSGVPAGSKIGAVAMSNQGKLTVTVTPPGSTVASWALLFPS